MNSKIGPLFAIAVGVFVLSCWLLVGHDILAGPNISMKAATAGAFVAAGVAGLCSISERTNPNPVILTLLGVSGFLAAIPCSVVVANWMLNSHSVFLEAGADKGLVAPGVPSVGTALCFYLLSTCWIAEYFKTARHVSRVASWIIIVLASISLFGYITINPVLYWRTTWSTAMSVHTSLCFLALALPFTQLPPEYQSLKN